MGVLQVGECQVSRGISDKTNRANLGFAGGRGEAPVLEALSLDG